MILKIASVDINVEYAIYTYTLSVSEKSNNLNICVHRYEYPETNFNIIEI